MRRVLAPLTSLTFVAALALAAAAQVNPPVPAPSGPVNPPGNIVTPAPAPMTPLPGGAPVPSETPSATPIPIATPTPPPIIVDPPQLSVEPNKLASARINSVLGTITVTVADPTVATAVVDQANRTLFVTGGKIGTTTVTVSDQRGLTRDVAVRVAYAAGSAADSITLRVTGNPASADYLREVVAAAVENATTLRPGASVNVQPELIAIHRDLGIDDRTAVDVPVSIAGPGYLTVNGTTHVAIENTALPPIEPARLLVSDYPERLTANGVLFMAQLDRTQAQRFLYYHYNPGTEPARRILLKAHNPSNAPATVQMIDGSAGPGTNEMEVGHLATKRFLVRQARNEGRVTQIAAGATVNLVDHPLPPQNVVSAILELRLLSGDPVGLTLVAQDAKAALDQSIDTTSLLAGGVLHARGIYPVPTFIYDRTYEVDDADLEIPIGQLPLPNLRQGEALNGDYGVEQDITLHVVNPTRAPRAVAVYVNPRGGRATGTFIVDGTLEQAHALPPFSKFKIWQGIVNAISFRTIRITTMPEGGSSYPVRLIVAPDDGSVAPTAPGSPVY